VAADDPGILAARARLVDLFERSERVELQVVVVAPPDDERLAARDHARTAAIVAGRHALLDEAMTGARRATLDAYARSGFSGTWAFTDMAMSIATSDDRLAAAAAFEEAAMAAVVEDLVDADTLEVLRSTADRLASMTGLPAPGALSSIASSRGSIRRPLGVAIAVLIIFMIFGIGVISASPT
jgi:hypothetical protein